MCVCVYVFVGIKGDKSSKGEEILLGRDLELLLIQLISGSYFVTHVVSSSVRYLAIDSYHMVIRVDKLLFFRYYVRA